MDCILCKMQYVGKAETAFNLRLNNHRKDTKKPNSILACKYFQEKGHNFNKHVKFIIIDKLVNLHGSKETLREMLMIRENFWIQKLKTLVPFGLNQKQYLTSCSFCQTQNFKKFPWRRPQPKLVGKLLFLLALYPSIHVLLSLSLSLFPCIYTYFCVYIHIIYILEHLLCQTFVNSCFLVYSLNLIKLLWTIAFILLNGFAKTSVNDCFLFSLYIISLYRNILFR